MSSLGGGISIKASLIINLIEAHCSGSEDSFRKALVSLADDEDRKGNAALSSSIRNSYSNGKMANTAVGASPLAEMSFSVQSSLTAPKDKDSTLELLEMLQPKVKLTDVALPQKTEEVLRQIVQEQRNSEILFSKGISPTSRVLFCGPPGCGKTLTAYALAGELDIPVAYVRLDGLVSSYLGQTGANIRKIFEFVKNKRVMLFLDEVDAIAKKRDDAHELGELKRVVTTLLQNMDSMPSSVFLVAATNHHHLLDPAIWRRFDTSILLDLPNAMQREQIIGHTQKSILDGYTIDQKKVVILTEGMSGAQICNFMQSLAKYSLMRDDLVKDISISDIASVWLKQKALFVGEDSETYLHALRELNENGVPLRILEEITGLPKSTISYRLGKEEKRNG